MPFEAAMTFYTRHDLQHHPLIAGWQKLLNVRPRNGTSQTPTHLMTGIQVLEQPPNINIIYYRILIYNLLSHTYL